MNKKECQKVYLLVLLNILINGSTIGILIMMNEADLQYIANCFGKIKKFRNMNSKKAIINNQGANLS